MITEHRPIDWRDLQDQVALILRECEFEVEVEKRVKTARGRAELDVYGEEFVHGRRY